MSLFNKLISSGTGVSHKRFISLMFAVLLFFVTIALFWLSIPESNEAIFTQIVYIIAGLISWQSGISVYEKFKKTDKNENSENKTTENVE
jgi:Flp pilus assembly protein TadB